MNWTQLFRFDKCFSFIISHINNDPNLSFQVFSGNIDSTVNVNRISIVYTNVELLPWISLIPRKRQKVKSDRNPRQTPLTINFEVWDLSAVALFQDALPLRSGITHVQLQLVDHPATGGFSCEFEAETVWCCLGNRTPSDPGQKKVHFWNSPIYVGLIIGKVERRLGILGMSDSIQSQLLLDVLRFEWSPNLMDTIFAIKKYLERDRIFHFCFCSNVNFVFQCIAALGKDGKYSNRRKANSTCFSFSYSGECQYFLADEERRWQFLTTYLNYSLILFF